MREHDEDRAGALDEAVEVRFDRVLEALRELRWALMVQRLTSAAGPGAVVQGRGDGLSEPRARRWTVH